METITKVAGWSAGIVTCLAGWYALIQTGPTYGLDYLEGGRTGGGRMIVMLGVIPFLAMCLGAATVDLLRSLRRKR